MTRYFVLVRPVLDEANRVTIEQANAAQQWLEDGEAAGLFSLICFARTGGAFFIDANSPTDITSMLTSYPLLDTIAIEIDELVPLKTGFDTLRANIERSARESDPAPPLGPA